MIGSPLSATWISWCRGAEIFLGVRFSWRWIDLVNLEGSAKLAIVVFGRDLTIRRFSPQAKK